MKCLNLNASLKEDSILQFILHRVDSNNQTRIWTTHKFLSWQLNNNSKHRFQASEPMKSESHNMITSKKENKRYLLELIWAKILHSGTHVFTTSNYIYYNSTHSLYRCPALNNAVLDQRLELCQKTMWIIRRVLNSIV
jgi:hypothetical protein